MNKENRRIKDELLAGRTVFLTTTGVSMEPLLHDKSKKNATSVLIAPVRGACKVGDMPLVLMEDGRYILHRIIRIRKEQGQNYYITRGDNCVTTEKITREQVLGIVSEICYPNKTIHVTDMRYRIYAHFWTIIYPVRRLHKKMLSFCRKNK